MASEQEFVVRVPQRDETKKYHVMKFRSSLNQDLSKWSSCKMVRENNQKVVQANIPQDDDPKFGAGSVFGKDMKEEARLKKLGIVRKKYDPDAQPWMMKVNGKGGKRFKGTREGGVSDNTSFYVFTHGSDGAFEAFPISEWYNFIPMQRYKVRHKTSSLFKMWFCGTRSSIERSTMSTKLILNFKAYLGLLVAEFILGF